MKTFFLPAVLCASIWVGACPAQGQWPALNPPPPADTSHMDVPPAAQAAADVWLGLVDEAQYDQAWQTTSGLFRKTVSQDQWTNLAKSHRTPLGKLLARKLTRATFSKTLPGAPEGQYVVIEYASSFERKPTARETATATLDSDGLWRVLGYFVR